MKAVILFAAVSVITVVLCAIFDGDEIKFFRKLMKKNKKRREI